MVNKTTACYLFILLFGVTCIVFSELTGVCVYQFRECLCNVNGDTAYTTQDYRGTPYHLSYTDKSLRGMNSTTCYVMTGTLGPDIELDTLGMVFSSCGGFSVFAIIFYIVVLLIYPCTLGFKKVIITI